MDKNLKQATVEEVRSIQLSILENVITFCSHNNIKMYLMYGTLLGAIRHKGFIPWDDDIDICMSRNDYNKFIEIYNKKQNTFIVKEQYHDPTYPYYYAKVCAVGTVLYEIIDGKKYNVGINIDLFPLDPLPNSLKLRKKFLKQIYFTRTKMIYNTIDKTHTRVWYKRVLLTILGVLFKKQTHKYIADLKKIVSQYNDESYDEVMDIMTPYGKKGIIKAAFFEETPIYVSFEGKMMPVPKDYDELLSHIYGDYMTPPEVQNQITHHTYIAYISK